MIDMIERIVLIKLNDELANATSRRDIAAHSREVLRALPGVVEVRVELPADPKSEGDWDLCIVVQLASATDIAPYVDAPAHRAFVDDYLRPRSIVIKAWNFRPLP